MPSAPPWRTNSTVYTTPLSSVEEVRNYVSAVEHYCANSRCYNVTNTSKCQRFWIGVTLHLYKFFSKVLRTLPSKTSACTVLLFSSSTGIIFFTICGSIQKQYNGMEPMKKWLIYRHQNIVLYWWKFFVWHWLIDRIIRQNN